MIELGPSSGYTMSRKAEPEVPPAPLPPEKAEKIRRALDGILASTLFRGSRRCQSLLRRIVSGTLSGQIDSLKERSLGVEVFGRSADYDTGQDPVVRVAAAEVRKKLAQYYQETGHQSEARIELPPGSYIAEFQFDQGRSQAAAIATRRSGWRLILIAAAISVTSLSVLAFTVTPLTLTRSDLDQLWEPVVKTPGSVLVGVGLQAAYNLRSAEAQDAVQGIGFPRSAGEATPRPAIHEKDLALVQDRYVALDDALCLVRLTALLDRHGKPFHIRAVQSMSFADLRDTPAVLIGAFDNPWTLRAADSLRFTFRKDGRHDTGMVYDRQHPENTDWMLTNYWPAWDISSDYAIVTRMLDATADRPVIIAAGLTQYGTVGAGELLSNPEYFGEAARHLPPDWRRKNLQIVLRVPVVNRIAGRPRVLASHVW
jgi:hypothetical protein